MKITGFRFCLMITALLMLGLAGCFNSTPIDQVVITSGVTASGQPELAADSFPPDVQKIYCSVKLSTTSASSEVKAEWYVAKSDEAGLTNSLIGNETLAASSPYIVFTFTRADKLLPKGDYEVKLYYDNKYQKSATFKVQGEASGPAATVSEATMCSAIDLLTNKPIDNLDTFPNDISKIFCSFKVSGAGINTALKGHWVYVGGEMPALAGKTINDSTTTAEGRDYISFSIGTPAGKPFPNGEYDLKLLVEDKQVADLPFRVVAPATIPGPFFAGMSTFTLGSDNKSATLTAQFPADSPQVNLLVKAYNVPANTTLDIQWIIAKSADQSILDTVVKEDKLPIQGSGQIVTALISRSMFSQAVPRI